MNIASGAASLALEDALAEKLRELLSGVSWLAGWSLERFPTISDRGFDFLVKLPLPKGGKAELWVECKTDPRPSQFPYSQVASEAKRPPVLVFAAPFISPRMAAVCVENGWSWFDLAGNCRIDVPGALHLERVGQKPMHKRGGEAEAHARAVVERLALLAAVEALTVSAPAVAEIFAQARLADGRGRTYGASALAPADAGRLMQRALPN